MCLLPKHQNQSESVNLTKKWKGKVLAIQSYQLISLVYAIPGVVFCSYKLNHRCKVLWQWTGSLFQTKFSFDEIDTDTVKMCHQRSAN